jgi:PKD repeat protein
MSRRLLGSLAPLLACGALAVVPAPARAETTTLASGEDTALCIDPVGLDPGIAGSPDEAALYTEHDGPFPDTGTACAGGSTHASARTGPGHPGSEGGPGNPAWPYSGAIPGASWVSINSSGEDSYETPRYYIYSTTFELCATQLEGTTAQGTMLADDAAGAFVNGVPIGHQPPNSHALGYPNENGTPTPFSYGIAQAPAALKVGVNTLQIVVLDEAPSLTGVDFAASVTSRHECREEEKTEKPVEKKLPLEGTTLPLVPAAPKASLALETSNPKPGAELAVTGAGSLAGNGHIISYDWDINGDGTIDTSTGTDPEAKLLLKPGFHKVGLTVTNSSGESSSGTLGVSVPFDAHETMKLPGDLKEQVECEPEASYDEGDIEITAECIHKVSVGEYAIESKQLELNGMVLVPRGQDDYFKIETVANPDAYGSVTQLVGPAVSVELLNTPIGNVVLGGRELASEPIEFFGHGLVKGGPLGKVGGVGNGLRAPLAHAADEEKSSKTLLFAFGVGVKCSASEAENKVGCCPPAQVNTACATLPGNFPIVGSVGVYVNSKGQSLFDVQVGIALKGVLEATGALEIEATPAGINLSSLKFKIQEAGFAGIFTVKEVSFSYDFPGDTEVPEEKRGSWQAKGKLLFGPEKPPPELELELAFTNKGNFKSGSVFIGAGQNGIPIFPGVELNKLGAGIGVEPLYFEGKLGALVGKALELLVEFRFHEETATEEGFFGLQGALELEEHKLGKLAVDLWFRGYINGEVGFDLRLPESSNPTVQASGAVKFWDETSSGRWQAEGKLALKLWEISAEVEALVNNKYIAGCLGSSGFGVQGSYDFADGKVGGSLFSFSNCSEQLKQYAEKALVKHEGGFVGGEALRFPRAGARGRDARGVAATGRLAVTGRPTPSGARLAAAGPSDSFTLPSGTRGEELRIGSSAGTPVVTLSGPGGVSFTTPVAPGQIVAAAGRYIGAIAPDHDQVLVYLSHPRGGEWHIQPALGSAPVDKLETAEGVAPATVRVHVRRTRGGSWSLAYRIDHHVAGTDVRFVERGPDSTHVLGTVSGASGMLRFTPQDAPGRGRTLLAYLTNSEGVPVRRLTVGHYTAPAAQRGGRVPHLRIVRRGASSALITWGAAAAARDYRIKVRGSDGRLQTLLRTPANRSVTLVGVLPFESFTATVKAVGGPNLLAGKPVSVRLAPIGKPRPKKPKRAGKR